MDRQSIESKDIPHPIGYYLQSMGGGLHGRCPIYGRRYQYLEARKVWIQQFQIWNMGDLCWINLDPDEFKPVEE